MGCDFPLKAYRTEERSPSGKRLITFNPLKAINSTQPMELPCGNCIGCKLERSRQWAVRMMHEAKLYDLNCFLTLTYGDDTVPQDHSLNLRHLQLFIKRLRKSLAHRIRFYACGEYGETTSRPHYHAIIFNHDFPDKKPHSKNAQGDPLYTSEQLTNLWQLGHALTGNVTYETAAYCARYVTKKIKTNDDYGKSRYFRLSPIDGQYYSVKPEFSVMSRRPGLGQAYVHQFKSDFFPSGYIVVNGVKQSPPRYYVKQLTEAEQKIIQRSNWQRQLPSKRNAEKTMERRLARAAVRDARISQLKRNLK